MKGEFEIMPKNYGVELNLLSGGTGIPEHNK
jgi:hypothetical protein